MPSDGTVTVRLLSCKKFTLRTIISLDLRSETMILAAYDTTSSSPVQWFAMSATFRRETKARAILETAGIECFIPMRYMPVTKRNGHKTKELIPAVHNLIFVHARQEEIQSVKNNIPYLQWLTMPCEGRNVPIIVPDKDMEQFIRVTQDSNEKLVYLRPDEIDLRKGTRVRIIGGPLDGVEGIFVRVKGSRSKKVVVLVTGLAAVVPAAEALSRAARAAADGAEATIPLVARKGRASYLGERSAGHKDPGAASFAYCLDAVAKAVAAEDARSDAVA